MKRKLGLIALSLTIAFGTAAIADSSNKVPYNKRVTVNVGEQIVVHGLRGECGKPPSKDAVRKMEGQYGALKLGKIVAGKTGVRNSNSCGGATPVVEAVFIAERKGKMKFELFGDPVSIQVK